MRGKDRQNGQLFCYVTPDSLIPPDHPLRTIRVLVNQALARMEPAFASIYAKHGRRSDPTGKTAARAVAAGAVLGALGAAADGAADL